MRAAQLGAFGLDHLSIVEVPRPSVGALQVAVEMKAWTLNYRDWLMARGLYDPRIRLPYVPLSDGVGIVAEVGRDVTRVKVGDRVCPTFSATWTDGDPDRDALRKTRGGPLPGVLAEVVVVGEAELVAVPPSLTNEEAAALPCAGVTAWSAVVGFGRLSPGQTALVIGSGGVSTMAALLARASGARVVAITSSDEKAARWRDLGAHHTISRLATPAWGKAAREWSSGGVDLVVEVGGAGTLAQSLDAVRPGGTVAVIGNLAGSVEPLSVLPILMRQIRCQGVFVGPRQAFEDLVRAVAFHDLRPPIDQVYPLAEARQAFESFATGRHFGKVALTLDG